MSGRVISIERRRINRLAFKAQTNKARNEPIVRARGEAPSAVAPDPAARPTLRTALEARRLHLTDASTRHRINELHSRVDPASSLRDEVLGDGVANCLERAVQLAQPGDDVVLLNDSRDDSGHAVVRRADGTVSDPNSPEKRYDSLEAYQAEQTHYEDPVTLTDTQAETVLRTPPGAERDAKIQSMGLDGIADRRVADVLSGIDDIRIPAPAAPKPKAAAIEKAAKPRVEEAKKAQVTADSAQGFADYAVADAGSLGIASPTLAKVEEEANTVRREKLPALVKEAEDKTDDANRALATETFKELGIDATEEDVAGFSGVLGEAKSEEERRAILERTVDTHTKQQTFDELSPQVDGWVTDTLGEQGSLVDREDLLLDVESMVVDGMSPTQIEAAIRGRLENVQTRGLDSISGGTVVEGFSEADVVNVGLGIDNRNREATRREVLDTLQVTLDVRSDEALAEQLGVDVDQLGDTLLVRNAQNAENPEDVITGLQEDPQYQMNAERRRLTTLATDALADGGSLGLTQEDMGLQGVTDMTTIGEIIDNSSGVDAALVDLGQSLGPDGEAITVNLTQQERNDLALERGFLARNGYSTEEIDSHLAIRANTLHWQNESKQEIADWQAQGVIPEFGYDSEQSGRQLDLENNAARTQWALGIAEGSADDINAQQADDIGVTEGVKDATTRLQDHWVRENPSLGSDVTNALNYTFGGGSSYTDALNRLQENPSVDEIQEFRDNIDEILNNDIYHLPDETRAMFEASRAEFDEALASAQATRDGAAGDKNLAVSQGKYDEMIAEFDRVNTDAGGWIGRFNKEALSLDDQTLGAHADMTEEEITAFEVLANIPEDERTSEQQAAYSILNQALLGTNDVTGVNSGTDRFDQGQQVADNFETFINDGSKQNIILGSVIVGTGVSFLNPVGGGAIIVGGTGGGLSLDKVTGNEDLTWKEVATETGIAGGSVVTGYGVAKVVGRGSRLLHPTGRGSRLAVGGGTFLTEEAASEVLINGGSAYARGDRITAGTLFDPVGLLYGLPFAGRDAAGIIRRTPKPGVTPNNIPSLDASVPGNVGAGQQPPAPSLDRQQFDELFYTATPAARAELGQLTPADLSQVFPNGAYPRGVSDLAEIPGFANLVKTDPYGARRLVDAGHHYGRGRVIDSFNAPNTNGAATLATWDAATPRYTPHPNDPWATNSAVPGPGFVVANAGQFREPSMPELHVTATGALDHNGGFSQPGATNGLTNMPSRPGVRAENVIVDGRALDNLDGVAVFGSHGGTEHFGETSTEQAADMMFRSISDASANPNNPRNIDSVVVEACSQRNCRLDLKPNGFGLVRSNARDFERILNDKLRAGGVPEVSVFAGSRNGPTFGGDINYQGQRPDSSDRPLLDTELDPTSFVPASAFPRPYPSTVRDLRNGGLGIGAAGAAGAGGAYIYTKVSDDDE